MKNIIRNLLVLGLIIACVPTAASMRPFSPKESALIDLFSQAIETNNEVEFKKLMGRADQMKVTANIGRVLMRKVASHNRANLCILLINHGVNCIDRALEAAVQEGHESLCKLLLAHGANPNIGLIFAAMHGQDSLCKLFLAHGANVNFQISDFSLWHRDYSTRNSYTALMLAAQNGHIEICKILLDAGARINIKTGGRYGPTAIELASNKYNPLPNHTKIRELLSTYKATANTQAKPTETAQESPTAKPRLTWWMRLKANIINFFIRS